MELAAVDSSRPSAAAHGFGVTWIAFSLLFGVGGAAWCFGFAWSNGVFGEFTAPACVYALACMSALSLWVWRGGRSTKLDGWLAGVMLAALLVAVPFALLLGVLFMGSFVTRSGMSGLWLAFAAPPLACTWIYGRNAWLAFASARRSTVESGRTLMGFGLAPLAAWIVLCASLALQRVAFERVLSPDVDDEARWLALARPLCHEYELPTWRASWLDARNENTAESLARAERIARAHEDLTGNSLENDSD